MINRSEDAVLKTYYIRNGKTKTKKGKMSSKEVKEKKKTKEEKNEQN